MTSVICELTTTYHLTLSSPASCDTAWLTSDLGPCCALGKLHKILGSFALSWLEDKQSSPLCRRSWPQDDSMIAQRCILCTDRFQAAGAAGRSQGRRNHRIYCFQTTDKQAAKQNLRFAIGPTQRGGSATRQQRGVVLEAQVELEGLSKSLDYDLLPGKWKLVYTSAPDVAPLVASNVFSSLLPVKIGDIYQEFSTVELGQVKNIITFEFAGLLNSGTAEVRASYAVRSPRRIRLQFEEAGVRDFRISDQAEAFLAPALLPRGWVSHQALLALREAEVFIPFRSGLPRLFNSAPNTLERNLERNFGSEYLLTYLDEDTLIGSQTGTGGTFIFERA